MKQQGAAIEIWDNDLEESVWSAPQPLKNLAQMVAFRVARWLGNKKGPTRSTLSGCCVEPCWYAREESNLEPTD